MLCPEAAVSPQRLPEDRDLQCWEKPETQSVSESDRGCHSVTENGMIQGLICDPPVSPADTTSVPASMQVGELLKLSTQTLGQKLQGHGKSLILTSFFPL